MNKHSSSGTKTGDLRSVWMAAYFPKQIKKELVQQTNICSSVDKILLDQIPYVTYRILGFLLLGVARIHSKKYEYLLVDSIKSQNEIKLCFEGRRKVDINVAGMCLPESSNHRTKSNAIDVPVSESSTRINRYSFVEAMSAQFSSISLPQNFELDAFDLEIVENDSSDDHVKSHLELVLQDTWESDRTQHHSEISAEKFRHRFILDDRLEPMVLDETDEELDLDVVPVVAKEPERDNINDSLIVLQDVQLPDKRPDEECTTAETVVSEMASVDNLVVKPSPDIGQLSVTINVTPQSKATVVSGEQMPEFMAIRTPASKSDARAPRKRKSAFDETITIPNKVYKGWLGDASDIVRKRRRPSLSARTTRQSSDYIQEPIIPSDVAFPSDLNSFLSTKDLVVEQEGEVTGETEPKTYEVEPVVVVDEASDPIETEIIAPTTPVTETTSVRYKVAREMITQNQVGIESSCETGEKERHLIQDVDFDEVQTKECAGPSSLGEDNQESVVAEKWSAVTKSVASYLHDNFVNSKKSGEEEVVKLSQVLKHKTKKESATFFYQILVLKTGGYINVKQEKAYDEISVMQTPKLEEVFAASSNK
ncbi:sister chromatid cohesion 1 protein 2-like [Rutidosis leptorrhynchoides]|uniref:sister chromatid cohesion 1 protein 2-like n=1 Tax=Rutidosis leptorrhynchoides TaxID=125765 RepID=UPI003A9A1DD7